ncbi:ABC transporter permease [Rhodocytophaga rosea]|uniref:Transport permease protein n=1 Tax=Rhodocytophaga rosea TaxID=2704465 RepID=A0A6C0GR43_9BACT|nr:ABC transporter permease [Rhodocytophaga rosea]QHT70536.1 ABC transporter permease [Rhodocytophaga rosea]
MQKLVIDANQKNVGLQFQELWHFKDLFLILAYRDLRVRYAQTFLGLLWAVLQPLCTVTIFVLVFGKGMGITVNNVPYSLFASSGMCAWTYFAFVMNQAGNSIISSQGMIQKIYFPRLIIPLSKAVVGLVDFTITLVFVAVLMLYFQFIPPANIVFLPLFIVLTVMAALGMGIWLSALTIRYRDFQHIIPFMVQFGLYATPVAYPSYMIPQQYQFIYHLNPMAGVVEGFHWSLTGGVTLSQYAYVSYALIILVFITGLFYFRRVEQIMADIV